MKVVFKGKRAVEVELDTANQWVENKVSDAMVLWNAMPWNDQHPEQTEPKQKMTVVTLIRKLCWEQDEVLFSFEEWDREDCLEEMEQWVLNPDGAMPVNVLVEMSEWWCPFVMTKIFHGDAAALDVLTMRQQPFPWDWKKSLQMLFPDQNFEFTPMENSDRDPNMPVLYMDNFAFGVDMTIPKARLTLEDAIEQYACRQEEVMTLKDAVQKIEEKMPYMGSGTEFFFNKMVRWHYDE